MHRIALGVAYSGERWHGWQRQPHGLTIQDQLEKALATFLKTPVSTICAGRTDTGVHALEQVVHLDTTAKRAAFSWVRGLNTYLPPSIRVQWAQPVQADFHARFSARARHYVYRLHQHAVPTPFATGRAGWVFQPLSLELLQAAAAAFVGTHDFSAFRSAECQAKNPVRDLQALEVRQQGEYFIFYFRANGFLHHMIRNIMGVLVAIGAGKKPVGWVAELLASKNRQYAAPTFSPAGLYLVRADYDSVWGLPQQDISTLLHRHLGVSY